MTDTATPATLAHDPLAHALPQPVPGAEERNPGMPLDPGWVASVAVNDPAVTREAHALPRRRPVDPARAQAWLLRLISCIDLTTLSGDDTPGRVQRLCAKAQAPLRADLAEALGAGGLTVGAVCVYHEMVEPAVAALAGSGISVAAVSAGFPAGLSPLSLRLQEIKASVAAGATEIDIVIARRHVLTGNWEALYDEVAAMRAACGDAHLKAILATGELGSLRNVTRAALVAMMAGADFVKTSTGKEAVNATLPVSLAMIRAIAAYRAAIGVAVGFKPAGGISKVAGALPYLTLMGEELGPAWQAPGLFRIGASSLLADIEARLDRLVTGAASDPWRHPLG